MRRLVGVLFVAVLALAQCRFVALASPFAPANYDLSAALFKQVFGESEDPSASVAAAFGDRASESPLRDLALEFVPGPQSLRAGVGRSPLAVAYVDLLGDPAPRVWEGAMLAAAPPATRTPPPSVAAAFPVEAYQPVQPAPDLSLQSGAVSFVPLTAPPARTADAGFTSNASVPQASGTTNVTPSDERIGPLQFQTRVEGKSAQLPQLSLKDSAYGAGANFAVRAGQRNLNVDLSSSYEQMTRNDMNFASSSATSSLQLPGTTAAFVVPNTANLSRLSVGAGVAVPLVNGLTLNLNYDTARLLGSYGLPGLANLDAIDNAYGAGLTFALPHWSSTTLSLSAYQYRYQDNILPANSSSQTRGNLSLTVKF